MKVVTQGLSIAVAVLVRPQNNYTMWVRNIKNKIPQAVPVVFTDTHDGEDHIHKGYRLIGIKNTFPKCNKSHIFEKNQYCHSTELSNMFSSGYKNMCNFWYMGAWDYLKQYDVAVRIDEDVIVEALSWKFLLSLNTIASPFYQHSDRAEVTVGMKDFFGLVTPFVPPALPYSNVMAVNMTWLSSSGTVAYWFQKVKKSNCICINRWGDLPLWGYTLAAIKQNATIMCGWKYYHGSHKRIIVSKC